MVVMRAHHVTPLFESAQRVPPFWNQVISNEETADAPGALRSSRLNLSAPSIGADNDNTPVAERCYSCTLLLYEGAVKRQRPRGVDICGYEA